MAQKSAFFCLVSFALKYLQCGRCQSDLFWLVFITVVSTGHPSNISIFSDIDKYWRIESCTWFLTCVCIFRPCVNPFLFLFLFFLIFIRTVRTSVLFNNINININTTITLKSMGVHLSWQLFVFQVSYGGSVQDLNSLVKYKSNV